MHVEKEEDKQSTGCNQHKHHGRLWSDINAIIIPFASIVIIITIATPFGLFNIRNRAAE